MSSAPTTEAAGGQPALRAGAVRESDAPRGVPSCELPGWSERFGVVAGITTRGSDPSEPFDLGLWGRAPVGEVMGRWRAFRRHHAGFGGFVLAHQVHGTRVLWHERIEGWLQLEGADGHATAARGLLLTVTVADCVPVYLVDPRRGALALLHAGWRGAAGGILRAGLELLRERAGSDPRDVVMHTGVGVCGDCYEVGSEVLSALGLPVDGEGPWHVDIRDRLLAQARWLGIGEATRSAWCTAHDGDRFFSHRASGGADGRMVAYLGFR